MDYFLNWASRDLTVKTVMATTMATRAVEHSKKPNCVSRIQTRLSRSTSTHVWHIWHKRVNAQSISPKAKRAILREIGTMGTSEIPNIETEEIPNSKITKGDEAVCIYAHGLSLHVYGSIFVDDGSRFHCGFGLARLSRLGTVCRLGKQTHAERRANYKPK